MAKIQAEKEAAQQAADAERISGAASRAFQEHMFNEQNAREDYTYQRDLPTNTYDRATRALGT
jgi:antirestriction protein